MSAKRFFVSLVLVASLLAACAPSPAPTAPPTAKATEVPATVAATQVPTIAPTEVPTQPPPTETPAPVSISVVDGRGKTITLAQPAQRILSLAASNTELLFAVGAGAQMVGREDTSDFPAEAQDVASIGSTYGQLNTEAIVALKPDLILVADINSAEHIKALEDLKLTVFLLSNPTDFDGLYKNVETVGTLTGHATEAETLNASLKARVDAVLAKTQTATPVKVFYELDGTDPLKPWTANNDTFVGVLMQLAGGDNAGGALTEPYAQISSEELVKQNPAIILLGDAAYGTTPEMVAQRTGWQKLTAVKNNQIFAFDDNLVSRPGPRLVDGLEQLAKLLHPELFK
jgi:iron complex transport system substrate-binding protein